MRLPRLGLAVALAIAGTTGISSPAFPATSWHVVVSGNSTAQDELARVSIVSAGDAWAVGDAYSVIGGARQERPLIEHYSGTAWQVVTSPAPTGFPYVALRSVVALTAGNVWAVGEYHSASDMRVAHPLVEHYDGTAWSIVAVPQADPRASFAAVSASSASDVWAVGSTGSRSASGTTTTRLLVEHFDGRTWGIVPTPALPQASLSGVVARSPADVWAIGDQAGSRTPLVLHFDGTAWSAVAVPAPPVVTGGWSLTDITASPTGQLWAAGHYSSPDGTTEHGLAARLRNGTWSVATLPEPGGSSFALPSGVAAAADDDVWVVGSASPGDQTATATAVHYDGTAWRLVPPTTVDTSSVLAGVATGPGGTWAVGYRSGSAAAWQTLTESCC